MFSLILYYLFISLNHITTVFQAIITMKLLELLFKTRQKIQFFITRKIDVKTHSALYFKVVIYLFFQHVFSLLPSTSISSLIFYSWYCTYIKTNKQTKRNSYVLARQRYSCKKRFLLYFWNRRQITCTEGVESKVE